MAALYKSAFADGMLYCTYTYDVWGNILSVKDTNDHELTAATDIANLQSLKYRGYYYDYETGLYYLQSRYYDPVTHRFINADGLVSTGTGVLGYNMFAYTLNCPVSLSDSAGNRPIESTTVSGESRDNRKLSCEHQRKALAETKKMNTMQIDDLILVNQVVQLLCQMEIGEHMVMMAILQRIMTIAIMGSQISTLMTKMEDITMIGTGVIP